MKLFTGKLTRFFQLLISFLFFTFSSISVFAADNLPSNKTLWKSIGENTQVTKQVIAKNTTSSLTARLIELDEIGFKTFVNEKTLISSFPIAAKNNTSADNKIITLPLPDGSEVDVEITPSKLMSDALALKFPQIQTWDVKGITEDITGTIDFTYRGFHGMLLMPDGDRVFIEPDFELASSKQGEFSSQGRYISFSNRQNKENFNKEFSCGVHDDKSHLNFATKNEFQARPASDLITYRLAVAATGEYSQFHGGTVASALSAIVTTISRVNQIYRRDFSIQFELVAEQDDIIYLNPFTDPYTNSDISALIRQNDINLSSNGVLNKNRYDVGHVFGEGNVGGLAVVGGICDNEGKAFGATGISSPVGDAFDLDFVAHELGHQLGATHTFNSACGNGSERTGATAVEPGSGTTIMAYPGICQENNIQNNVDPQFHIASIIQIRLVTRSGGGTSCGVRTSTVNENPTVNAGADKIVPARTPLVFIAEGADPDSDALTYSWEQTDTGTTSALNVDTGDNALFRSRPLSTNNVRFIPRLSDLFAATTSAGELLPIRNRDINMAATVRDDKGGLEFDDVKYQIFDTGEQFRVTSQTNNQSFGRQDTADIRWNVAGTNSSPISCANVDIGVATSDGQGFDITTTANDGSHTITIPSDAPATNNARFIVSCSSSNFFNVSSGRITILDQVGGGSVETDSGGGGSFNIFMLLWAVILVSIRKLYRPFSKLRSDNKKLKSLVLVFPFLASVQACSSPVINESESSNTGIAKSKNLEDRFSIEKIKQEREAYYVQKRTELKNLNPANEVKKALQSNNIYFMAVAAGKGSSFSIPGLVEPQPLTVNCKTVAVEGMGDVLYGKNHILYRQEMMQYMRDFNALMRPYCK